MSIPLDRLYDYIESLCSDDIIIYRWFPHGSKNLSDLSQTKYVNIDQVLSLPIMVAHDQEPLDYDYFETQGYQKLMHPNWYKYDSYVNFIKNVSAVRCKIHIWNVHEKFLLCHSEKNSSELEKFNADFIGVYYWSHALIARDWFRFAEHDSSLHGNPTNYTQDFLIYNRAWAGSREYRLKFAELLVNNNLINCSHVKFSPTDNGLHYSQHNFKNSKFKIDNFSLETLIPENTFSPCASADYVANDYNSAGIEVVLETIFDDQRMHLTEKILRPIACGKPFILASSPGALQYLRDYGFKTFDGLIDESYDTVADPVERLECIVREMTRISQLSVTEKSALFSKLNAIAEYNKTLFFSAQWHQTIVDEFVSNFNCAIDQVAQYRNSKKWANAKYIIEQDEDLSKHALKVCSEQSINMLNSVYSQFNSDVSQ